jgi:hypothetical protein
MLTQSTTPNNQNKWWKELWDWFTTHANNYFRFIVSLRFCVLYLLIASGCNDFYWILKLCPIAHTSVPFKLADNVLALLVPALIIDDPIDKITTSIETVIDKLKKSQG